MSRGHMETFGARLRTLRAQQGLNMREFGALIGVSHGTVFKWEDGKAYPCSSRLVAISKALDCTPDFLLGSWRNDIEALRACIMAGMLSGDITRDRARELLRAFDVPAGDAS